MTASVPKGAARQAACFRQREACDRRNRRRAASRRSRAI